MELWLRNWQSVLRFGKSHALPWLKYGVGIVPLTEWRLFLLPYPRHWSNFKFSEQIKIAMAAAAGACISFRNSPLDLPHLGVQLGTSKTVYKVHIITVHWASIVHIHIQIGGHKIPLQQFSHNVMYSQYGVTWVEYFYENIFAVNASAGSSLWPDFNFYQAFSLQLCSI